MSTLAQGFAMISMMRGLWFVAKRIELGEVEDGVFYHGDDGTLTLTDIIIECADTMSKAAIDMESSVLIEKSSLDVVNGYFEAIDIALKSRAPKKKDMH